METRMNRKAVSPVIAIVLLVTITVVLAVVLYALVGGIGNGIEAQEFAGVLVGDTQDGLNWQITFVTLPAGELPTDNVYLVLYQPDGSIALEKTALSDIKCPPGLCGFKIRLNQITADSDTLSVGDNITIDKARHPIGARFTLVTDAGILASGTFA